MTFIIVLVLTQTITTKTKIYTSAETWKLLFLTAGLLTYAGLLFFAGNKLTHTGKFTLSCLAPVLLMFSGHFVIPNQLIESKNPSDFLLKHKDRINARTRRNGRTGGAGFCGPA